MQRKRAALVRGSTGAHSQAKEACTGGCSSNFEGFSSHVQYTSACRYLYGLRFQHFRPLLQIVAMGYVAPATGTGRSYCFEHTRQALGSDLDRPAHRSRGVHPSNEMRIWKKRSAKPPGHRIKLPRARATSNTHAAGPGAHDGEVQVQSQAE